MAPSSTAPSTIFAIPRAVLRSVVVHPQMHQLKHSDSHRILPPPRSPSPFPADDSQFDIKYSQEVEAFENDQTCSSNFESTTKVESVSPQKVEEKSDEEQTVVKLLFFYFTYF